MCLQLFSPNCLRRLYSRPRSVVNCNYPYSINEEIETQETEETATQTSSMWPRVKCKHWLALSKLS